MSSEANNQLSILVTFSGIFWISLYSLLRLVFHNRNAEFSNRIVTFFHGLIITILGLTECFQFGWAFNVQNDNVTSTQRFILLTSEGYFIFDLIWCLYYQSETKLMIGHHIYSVFAIYRLLMKNSKGLQTSCALGGMELTNPLLQTRWFIRTLGYHKTKLYVVIEVFFIFLFIVVRLIIGTLIGYFVLLDCEYDWEFKGLGVLIYIVSWAFVIHMLKYIFKKYFSTEEERHSE